MKFLIRFSCSADSVKIPSVFSLRSKIRRRYHWQMWYVVFFLWAINGLTLALFGWDKLCARRRKLRVPERRLLWCAALGGSPAALLSRWIFRHKTRKHRFTLWLLGIFGVQVLVGYLAATGGWGFG
ncbi:MAG: DUF1294 domain-containing protein [Paracoccaceae bacterium]